MSEPVDNLQEALRRLATSSLGHPAAPPAPEVTEEAGVYAERRRLPFESRFNEARLKDLELDTELKRRFADRVHFLIVGWLVFVAMAVFLVGSSPRLCAWCGFWLSDKVLITMLSSTTVSVLGVLMIVVRHLFPRGR